MRCEVTTQRAHWSRPPEIPSTGIGGLVGYRYLLDMAIRVTVDLNSLQAWTAAAIIKAIKLHKRSDGLASG